MFVDLSKTVYTYVVAIWEFFRCPCGGE